MNLRSAETRLAWFTCGLLVVYFPLETWASLPHGLSNPFYLVDLVAMALLLYGAVLSLRARPRAAPGVLCAAYGWAAANAWRATLTVCSSSAMAENWNTEPPSCAWLDAELSSCWAVSRCRCGSSSARQPSRDDLSVGRASADCGRSELTG